MKTLLDTLACCAAHNPDKPAFITPGREATFGEFLCLIQSAKDALRRLGFEKGESILFSDQDKVAYTAVLLACVDLGLVFVPIDSQSSPAWRERISGRLGISGDCHGLGLLLAHDVSRSEGARRIAKEDDVIAVLMTSGSTGVPKGVPIHASMAAAAIRNTVECLRINEETVFLDYIPPFTVGGLFLAGLPVLFSAGLSLSMPFSPFAFAGLVAEKHPTHSIILPTMAAVLRNTTSWPSLDLSCFETLASGASVVPESVAHEMLERGVRSFLHIYGSTECLTPVVEHRVDAGPDDGRPKTIFSKLCGDYEAEIAPDGELLLRGTAVTRGYLDEADSSDSATQSGRGPGWFETGDLFAREETTWRFIGRKKEILKIGGFSVSPAMTEKTIMDLPGVRNCAAVVQTLRSGGEVLLAVVEGDNLDPGIIISHCQQNLPSHQTPRRVVLVDRIPLNPMRKVDRQAVRTLIGS